jgi:hypothetical protein
MLSESLPNVLLSCPALASRRPVLSLLGVHHRRAKFTSGSYDAPALSD